MVGVRSRRWVAAVTGAAVALGGLLPTPAWADSAPVPGPAHETVTADGLPTVQIDGVVWSQVVVGRTVYAAGSFTTARPAGSSPGTNTVPRANLLAFDIQTGALVPGFDPVLNGQARSITRSPDGSRVYVVGDFTRVDGVYRVRIAAFDTATGALVAGFRPTLASAGLSVAATDDTVYVGGNFTSVAGVTGGTLVARGYLAAFDASSGAVEGFRADANAPVTALAATVDGTRVVVGGRFTTLAGASAYGLGSVDPISGARQPFPASTFIRNAGTTSALTSLLADETGVYGTGYHFGSGGNLEGTFRADATTGTLTWVADCHGDTYSVFPQGDVVYSVGHAHYCGNLPGGFPQTTPWTFHHVSAFTIEAQGVNTPDIYNYQQHPGEPAPGWLHVWPEFYTGTYTGQGQAGWSITGNDEYLVMGGEFTGVNGAAQQGLVRFARTALVTDRQGPRLSGSAANPRLSSTVAGTVQVQWSPNWDRDNETLTYRLYRGSLAAPVHTRTVTARTWVRAAMGFTDTGLSPGSTQQYRLTATDPFGNVATSGTVSVTVAAAGTASAYLAAVRADEPAALWRLDETSGTTLRDAAGTEPGTAGSGVTRGTPGAVGDGTTASTFSGTSTGSASSTVPFNAPDAVTVEAWVRTTSTRGGKVVGFGSSQTGTSTAADRHLYLDNAGRVFFGMHASGLSTVNSPGTYRDGQWHHLVGTYGGGAMRLYVDGVLVAQRTDIAYERSYWGYWRIGGDRLTSWPSRPSSDYLAGAIDDVAVYWRALPADRVLAHFQAARGVPVNSPPVAAFTASTTALHATVDATTSTDPDGTVTGWAWTFGDGGTASGTVATHAYAAAGTYPVTLTVTDDDGATATLTRAMTVSDEPVGDLAVDTFTRELATGWGDSEVGGAWTLLGASTGYAVTGGRGEHRVAIAGSTRSSLLAAVTSTDVSVEVTVASGTAATGGGTFLMVVGRRVGTGDYAVRIKLLATGAVTVQPMVGSTALASAQLPGTYTAGERLRVRLEVTGTSPTTLRARVWPEGAAEPNAWLVSATDASPAMQAPGAVGLTSYVSSGATTTPVTITWDDLRVSATSD